MGHKRGAEPPIRIAPTTGAYHLVATRYGGTQGDPNTTGDYALTVTQMTG